MRITKCMSSVCFCMSSECFPKTNFFCILMPLLMVPLSPAYQKLPKTIETTHLK